MIDALRVLYEDGACIAVEKPQGIPSEDAGDASLPARVRTYLGEGAEVYPVHRLDKPTGGAILYAKTKEGAAFLSSAVIEHRVGKRYLAVAVGIPEAKSGTLTDYLYHDKRQNKVFVVKNGRKGAKEAILDYRVLASCDLDAVPVSLLLVTLKTGRTHQIRAQLASRKMPVYGDRRYGSKASMPGGRIALWSCELTFPKSGGGCETVSSRPPVEVPWTLFQDQIRNILNKETSDVSND